MGSTPSRHAVCLAVLLAALPGTAPAAVFDPISELRRGPEPFFSIAWSGAVVLATGYQDGLCLSREIPVQVLSNGRGDFGMGIAGTRFGVTVGVPSLAPWRVAARFDVDALGEFGGTGDALPGIRIRRAALEVLGDASAALAPGLLAGLDESIVSPLSPTLPDPGLGWGQGNLWQSVPQLAGHCDWRPRPDLALRASLALAMPAASDPAVTNPRGGPAVQAGEAAGLPHLQAALSFAKPVGDLRLLLALTAAYGKEDYGEAVDGNGDTGPGARVDSRVLAVSAMLAHRFVSLRLEGYTGRNLDSFGAQWGYGVRRAPDGTVTGPAAVKGGWIEASGSPASFLDLAIGYGIDQPDAGGAGTPYSKNSATWVSLLVRPWPFLEFGLSFRNIETDYPGREALRAGVLQQTTRFVF